MQVSIGTACQPDAPELQLSRLLDEYRQTREERLKSETKRKQAASGLLITGLQQTTVVFHRSVCTDLKVHRRTVKRQWEKLLEQSLTEDDASQEFDLLTGSVDNDDDRATLEEDQLQAEKTHSLKPHPWRRWGRSKTFSAKELFAHEQKVLDQ